MKVQDAIALINRHRLRMNFSEVEIDTRPGRSHPGKTIIISLKKTGEEICKSASWGPISKFLQGMLMAYSERPIAAIEPPKKGRALMI